MIQISKPYVGEEEVAAVSAVLRSGMIAQGPKVAELEKSFGKIIGSSHAIALNNGTSALHAALKAAGVGRGDEVITTPFTFIATANSILMQNATPVFCDIEEDTFLIDPKEIEKKITKRTKAIIAVDLYGQLANYKEIERICKEKNIVLIEDAAQSIGAKMDGRFAGTFGDAATFSFYATKNIHCGEGGMMTTSHDPYAKKASLFRQHGRKDLVGYDYDDLGYNYRMTDISAVIVTEQMKRLESFTKKRRENALALTNGISKIKGLIAPKEKYGEHAYHQYTIRVTEEFKMSRDELSSHLKKKGIESRAYYPLPLHLCTQFLRLGYKEGDFPKSEKASKEVLSLPVHPAVSKEDVLSIITALKEVSS